MAFHDAQTPEDLPREHQGEAPELPALAMSPRVWVVYVESNKAAEPVIVGVYATEALATAARLLQIDEEHNLGHSIWAVDEEDGDWDVDIHIETFTVQS